MIDGNMVAGAQNIFFAELASKSTEVFLSIGNKIYGRKIPVHDIWSSCCSICNVQNCSSRKEKR